MNTEATLQGVGYIALAIADLLLKKDYALAFTDFMKGLGSFGVHTSITQALQAPVGQAAPQFQHLNTEDDKPNR